MAPIFFLRIVIMNIENQKKIIKKNIANIIISRIKDDSVEVIWCDLLKENVIKFLELEFQEDIDEVIYNDNVDEVISESLHYLDKKDMFEFNLENTIKTARKRYIEEISGINFLIGFNVDAVIEFGKELIPYLKKSDLNSMHLMISEFYDEILLSKCRKFFSEHQELVPEQFKTLYSQH